MRLHMEIKLSSFFQFLKILLLEVEVSLFIEHEIEGKQYTNKAEEK